MTSKMIWRVGVTVTAALSVLVISSAKASSLAPAEETSGSIEKKPEPPGGDGCKSGCSSKTFRTPPDRRKHPKANLNSLPGDFYTRNPAYAPPDGTPNGCTFSAEEDAADCTWNVPGVGNCPVHCMRDLPGGKKAPTPPAACYFHCYFVFSSRGKRDCT